MIINHLIRRTTLYIGSQPKNSLKQRGLIVAGSFTCIYGCVKLASCDALSTDTENENKNIKPVNKSLGRLNGVYTDHILHSSLFRFGRAAYTVSDRVLIFSIKG